MSYEIIYQYRVFTEQRPEVHGGEQKFVVAIEAGSNNCYDHGNHRARSWQVLALGSHDDVMRQILRCAGSCESGMLKPGGKDMTPEAFIRKIRRLLGEAARNGSAGAEGGWWYPSARVDNDTNPAIAERARALGAEMDEDVWFGQKRVRANFDGKEAGFWEFVREMHRTRCGWQLANVHGLKAS